MVVICILIDHINLSHFKSWGEGMCLSRTHLSDHEPIDATNNHPQFCICVNPGFHIREIGISILRSLVSNKRAYICVLGWGNVHPAFSSFLPPESV